MRTALCLLTLFAAQQTLAFGRAPPQWVTQRPVNPAYYIGIAMTERKGPKNEYTGKAKDAALADLASEISVTISSTFFDLVVEQGGVSEESLRSEIHSSTKANLSGYERVATWSNRREYWVYYKLPKAVYRKIRLQNIQKATATARDFFLKAGRAGTAGDTGAALTLYLQAFNALGEFVGDPLKTDVQGRQVVLPNEIFQSVHALLRRIELRPERKAIWTLSGRPPTTPLTVTAVVSANSTETGGPAAGLPILFSFTKPELHPIDTVRTDAHGIAALPLRTIENPGSLHPVRASLDLAGLLAADGTTHPSPLVTGLAAPETLLVVKTSDDKEQVAWGNAFEGRTARIFCAYGNAEHAAVWTRMRDELARLLSGAGADIREPAATPPATVLQWSAAPKTTPANDTTELTVLFVAGGTLKRRKSTRSPTGEDCRFAGEIRSYVLANGEIDFSDTFSVMGGWNPMGEQMCMDVLALHAMKRFKKNYKKQLGLD